MATDFLGRIPQGKNEVFHTVDVDQISIVGTGGISSIGQIDIDSSQAAADAIRINASNAAGGIDVDAGTGGIAVDTTGGLSLDSTSTTVASNITTAGAAGFDLSIASTAGSLNLTGGEAAANAVRINASNAAGGIDVDAGTGGIDVDSTGIINIDSSSALGGDLALIASNAAGAMTLTAGTAGITFSTTGQTQLDGATFQSAAIAGVTTVTSAQSGTWFTVAQTSAYAITLPTPPTAGLYYKFAVITAGAFDVTISNGSAHLFGTIVNDVTSVIPATGTTLTIANATAAVGDSIEIYGLDATHYLVKAVTSTAGGITIA